jgi:hypothetical protein
LLVVFFLDLLFQIICFEIFCFSFLIHQICRLFDFAMDDVDVCIIESIGRVFEDIYIIRTLETFSHVQRSGLDVESVHLKTYNVADLEVT